MRTKKPKPLSNSINQLLKSMGIAQKIKEHQVLNEWPNLVGEQVAAVTHASSIIDGVMFVNVKSSSWRNELIFLKAEILHKIVKKVGTGVVHEIRFI